MNSTENVHTVNRAESALFGLLLLPSTEAVTFLLEFSNIMSKFLVIFIFHFS